VGETLEKKGEAIYPEGYAPTLDVPVPDPKAINQLLHLILSSTPEEAVDTELFAVMEKRRSTRKFLDKWVEPSKIDKILAAADMAPTAGNFQGFEIFYVRDHKRKEKLVEACNNQPYVNAPVVLVFCKNPKRVKLDFPQEILEKFAIQDATLAAAYSQLTAHALGLSSIWIGMLDEKKVMEIIGTDLVPSSLLCVGYPKKKKLPKPKRNLKDLVHVT